MPVLVVFIVLLEEFISSSFAMHFYRRITLESPLDPQETALLNTMSQICDANCNNSTACDLAFQALEKDLCMEIANARPITFPMHIWATSGIRLSCNSTKIITSDFADVPLWNEWTNWSACSGSCDSGIRVRNRTCDSPGGDSCQGTDSETGSCALSPCAGNFNM